MHRKRDPREFEPGCLWLLLLCLISTMAGCASVSVGSRAQPVAAEYHFAGISRIDMDTISGSAVVLPARTNVVHVLLEHDFAEDRYVPDMAARAGILGIEERITGKMTTGHATWRLWVPDGVKINFTSVSGQFSVDDYTGDIDVTTTSGNVEATRVKGQLAFDSTSGKINLTAVDAQNPDVILARSISGTVELTDTRGHLSVETTSGKISVSKLETTAGNPIVIRSITGPVSVSETRGDLDVASNTGSVSIVNSTPAAGADEHSIVAGTTTSDLYIARSNARISATSATGDVHVVLTPDHRFDVTVSSSTNDAVLELSGSPRPGQYEFQARERDGRIRNPFPVDREEHFFRGDRKYNRVFSTVERADPEYMIRTIAGTAEVRM